MQVRKHAYFSLLTIAWYIASRLVHNSGVSSANVLEKILTRALHRVKLAPAVTRELEEHYYFP